MKKLFTLAVLVCFSYTAANAQDKAAAKTERLTKLESKEALRKAQPQTRKISATQLEQKRKNVIRIDANNSKGIVLTEEQRKAYSKEKAAKANQSIQKRDEK